MPYTLAHLKSLKEFNLKIIGTDADNNALGKYLCDKFYCVPEGNKKNYIQECTKIIKKEHIELVIPTSDEEAVAFSRKKEFFQQLKVTIACVDYEKLKILNDKSKTYSYLQEHGVRVAKWEKVYNKEKLRTKIKAYIKNYGGAVVKPISERGSRNIFIISKNKNNHTRGSNILFFNSLKEFFSYLENNRINLKDFIIMQELNEPVVDVDLLSWKGKPISVIPRKRNNSLMPNMGHKILKNKKIKNLGKRVIKIFNLSWLYDCDIMFDNRKNPIIIEINPRQSGSIAVSIAAGYKVYENLLKIYLGEKPLNEETYKKGIIIPYKSLHKA